MYKWQTNRQSVLIKGLPDKSPKLIFAENIYLCNHDMKFLAIILSIYVLVLTILPCVDVPIDNLLHKTELAKASSDKHTDEADHCSPFCTCQCCASPMVFHGLSFELKFHAELQQRIYSYTDAYVSSHFRAIWQPPKIG